MAISFMDLPGELRNQIYHDHFTSTLQEAQGLLSETLCGRVETLKPALTILSTSHTIRYEASPIFWIDYVQAHHWRFGARHDDDDRMVRFCDAARKYTMDVDMTFQKLYPNTASLSANIVWLMLESTFDLPRDEEALRTLTEDWRARHRDPGGFVWLKLVGVREREKAITLKYTYHTAERSWVQFRGCLALVDWESIFAMAKAGMELPE